MSKFDKEYQDYIEEKILNKCLKDDEENNTIKNLINEYFDKDKIMENTYSENKEYLEFILDKI